MTEPVTITVDSTGGDTPPASWPGLLAADPAADYFHTPFWTRITAAHLPGGRPLWLTARRGEEILGGLAAVVHGGRFRRVHSGAHGCSGGPLIPADLEPDLADATATALLTALLTARGGGLATCGVALNPLHEERWGASLQTLGRFRRQDNRAAVIHLPDDTDELAACLRRSKRKERDRALRRGAVAEVSGDPRDLEAYHRLHVAACARWKVPAQPLGLLRDLLEAPAGEDGAAAFFVCVRCEGRVAGGHLNLHRGPWVTAWNGVTDPAFARTHYPATLAVWADMVEARRRGARWLDLGASGGQGSLEFFKEGFGAQDRARGWYVADTPAVRLARKLRGLVSGGHDDSGARWHDEPVPQDAPRERGA